MPEIADDASPFAPIGVLYIQHVGQPGGSARSLLGVVAELQGRHIRGHLVSQRGPVVDLARSLGCPCIDASRLAQFDNSANGSYRDLRWLITLREVAAVVPTLVALLRARREWAGDIDIVHVNEYSLLFTGLLAKWMFAVPLVVHVRARQARENRWRHRLLAYVARTFAARVVAIDRAVAATVEPGPVEIIHNGEVVSESTLATPPPGAGDLRVGLVANFLAYKGVEEFVEAASLCVNERQLDNVRFLVFGDSQQRTTGLRARLMKRLGFLHDVKAEVLARVNRENLTGFVEFRGFVEEVSDIYEHIDVLCFPSRLDAVGRPVFEAALFGRPSIVTLRSRREDDAVIHGRTGLIVPEGDAAALADAIQHYYGHPADLAAMGAAARQLARERFDIARNAMRLAHLYNEVNQR